MTYEIPLHTISPAPYKLDNAGVLSPPPFLGVVVLLMGIKYVCETWAVLLLSQGLEI